jgi:hypothetical protein
MMDIKSIYKYSAIGLLLLITEFAVADMIPLGDFKLLRRGMSEAEVLYRVGVFDYESVRTDHYQNIVEKRWYYIPHVDGSNKWITEIVINQRGEIKNMERYRANR